MASAFSPSGFGSRWLSRENSTSVSEFRPTSVESCAITPDTIDIVTQDMTLAPEIITVAAPRFAPATPVAEPPRRVEADLLVTESMAELLAQQGHAAEALTVYRHLESRSAGEPRFAALLLGLGLRNLSMAPRNIPRVKQRIRSLDMVAATRRARAIMDQSDTTRIAALLLDDFNTVALAH